ncbi:MAG TPA: EamA family transporter, partial [Arthrobacter bacterium]|nr:EamA family transporter [Arthrobacter sp.]
PVVGMSAAWLALGEVPTPAELAGGMLLLGGVATAVLTGRGSPGQRRVAGLAPVVVPGLGAGLRTGEADDVGRLAAAAGIRAGAREPDAR